MGKHSREKYTGKSLEERIAIPSLLNNTEDALKIQKQVNKQAKAVRRFMQQLYNSGRIGKAKS